MLIPSKICKLAEINSGSTIQLASAREEKEEKGEKAVDQFCPKKEESAYLWRAS